MDEHDDDILTAEAERARQAMTAFGTIAPGPAFRERLREEFVSGTIAPVPPAAAPEGGRAAGGWARARAPRTRDAGRWGAWTWLTQPIGWVTAAAAAIVIVAVGSALNAGPAWRLIAADGLGIATVDGRAIPINHTQELAAALTPGARVRVPPGCRIDLVSAGMLALQITAETDAVIPATPGRWFRRDIEAEIRSGEWRITTGPRFAGAQLAITTPSAHVEVKGTTLAVICEPEGTCVCVFEGQVRVGRDRSDMATVEQGRRRFVFMDATRDPESDVMRPGEVVPLGEFQQGMAGEMGRR